MPSVPVSAAASLKYRAPGVSSPYLIAIAPEVVLGSDVLVLILRPLFDWVLVEFVLPVLPMLAPQSPCVRTA